MKKLILDIDLRKIFSEDEQTVIEFIEKIISIFEKLAKVKIILEESIWTRNKFKEIGIITKDIKSLFPLRPVPHNFVNNNSSFQIEQTTKSICFDDKFKREFPDQACDVELIISTEELHNELNAIFCRTFIEENNKEEIWEFIFEFTIYFEVDMLNEMEYISKKFKSKS